jgi:hypothetical protein
LGLLRIRAVEQSLIVLATIVRGSGLLRPTNLEKQIVFLLLKLTIAGLQSLSVMCSGLLFGEDRLVLGVCVGLLTSGFFLLLLIRCVVGSLLAGI